MGLFGGETVYVSSVVYNMAGDLIDRPNFLKTTVVSNVISNSSFSMSETISSAYLNGPGIKIRSFHRWTKRPGNYDQVGVPFSNVIDEADLTPHAVALHIPHDSSIHYVSVGTYKYGPFSQSDFAEQFMFEYHYEVITEAWTSAYDEVTNQITITRADGVTTYTFTPAGFDPAVDQFSNYVYSIYSTRVISTGAWVSTRMWIYKIGTGYPDIDEMVLATDTSDEFLAFLPVRLKGKFLSSTYLPGVYAQTTRAYKKLTGQRLAKLIEKIEDNPDLGDIDHAYIVHGVCLNTQENASRKYLVHFFDSMLGVSADSWAAYQTMQTVLADWQADYAAWRESRATWADEHPGEPYPPPPAKPNAITPTTSITIKSNGDPDARLHMVVKWKAIQKFTGSGLGKPGAKTQEVWWGPVTKNSNDDEVVDLYWQNSATSYVYYRVIGLHHRNEVYNGESIIISVGEALQDTDESGFLVPIHYNTLKSMSLIDSTQMMLSSTYLVFNCYEVVKQKWYETTIFKIVIFVVIIAITVATGGAGAIGLLGTAGSVGASLGFTGLMATIVGAVANAIAAMILLKLISVASVAVFGDKLGLIIAAVASTLAMTVGAGMMSGQTLAQSWGSMMSASNLLQLTSAVGSGVQGYIQASTMETLDKTQKLMESYEAQAKKYTDMYMAEFGRNDFAFDPTMLTDANKGLIYEEPQMFLNRTLLTGSDIAQMSMDMLSNMANYTLTLKH